MQKPVAVLLSGCGVYDGSEIHEAVCTLLELTNNNLEYICIAPNENQLHVIHHTTGEVMNEQRNVLVESARIARGVIKDISSISTDEISALVIVGGFGAAKNLTTWALEGAKGIINNHVQVLVQQCVNNAIPVVGLCMGPTVIARALEGTGRHAILTAGSTREPSEYDIAAIHVQMQSLGAVVNECTIREIVVDHKHKIISAPCYMMQGNISDVHLNVKMAIQALAEMI